MPITHDEYKASFNTIAAKNMGGVGGEDSIYLSSLNLLTSDAHVGESRRAHAALTYLTMKNLFDNWPLAQHEDGSNYQVIDAYIAEHCGPALELARQIATKISQARPGQIFDLATENDTTSQPK